MTNPSSPRKPSWRDAAGSTPPAQGRASGDKAWQPSSGPTRTGWAWWKSRTVQTGFVLLALLGVVGAIVWVVRKYQPPPPVRLVLIGAGYEDNLAVPHNVPGRHGLDALEQWADEHNARHARSTRQRIDVERVQLEGEDRAVEQAVLAISAQKRKPTTVVVFVATHGLACSEGTGIAPCLVRQDDNLRERNALYRLDTLLDALAKLPDRTGKLLLLDATQVTAHWPLGLLHNDFARALEDPKRLERIREIPNLVIISSSGKDERSWVDEERRRTIFAHYVLEGLRGAADGAGGKANGRVDALELHHYVAEQVERWVRHNRARLQRPVLIGSEARARRLELVPCDRHQPADLPAEDEPRYPELEQEWLQCQQLRSASPSPAAYTPQQWRKYLATLLRCEQLARAGDRDTAAKLLDRVGDLRRRIVAGRLVKQDALPLTLAMPAALGAPPGDAQAVKRFAKLWEERAPLEEYGKVVAALEKSAPGRQAWQLLRLRLTDLVVRRVAQNPEEDLVYGRGVLASLDDPRPPWRPAEAHYVVMVRPDPEGASPSPLGPLLAKKGWPLLSKALNTRLRAEEAALGLGLDRPEERLPAYSERVLPRLRRTVEEADRKRRLGQDLLFTSDPQQWGKADELLSEAGKLHDQVQELAVEVRRAFRCRDEVLEALPWYTHWLAGQALTREEEGLPLTLWRNVHELVRVLEGDGTGQALADQRADLKKRVAAVDRDLRLLEKRLAAGAEKEAPSKQSRWHEIDNALTVPFLEPGLRLKLLADRRRISRELNEGTNKATSAQGVSPAALLAAARAAAERQGRLALARLGERGWPEFEKARNALNNPGEATWLVSMTYAGGLIGARLNSLPEEVQALTDGAAQADLERARTALKRAARLARQVEGAAVGEPRLTADPVEEERRLLLHDLLCWQAGRTFLDYWASEKQGPDVQPYYRLAGLDFLRAAQPLVGDAAAARAKKRGPRLAQIDKERARLEAPGQVVVEWSPDALADHFRPGPTVLDVTDDRGAERFYRLGAPPGVPEGAPSRWVEVGSGLRPARAEEAQRQTVEFGKPFGTRLVVDDRVPIRVGRETRRHVVRGFFRGHRSAVETTVRWQGQPDLTVVLPPRLPAGRVAVQTRRKLHDRFGASNAAIALVLDCSESMKAVAKGERESRFRKATRALREVLALLPPGVTVSLRAFGAEQFTRQRDENYEYGGIRLVWKAHKWDPDALDARMKPVERLTPRWGTPLIRSIWQARNDFPEDFQGTRAIVVLTDGADSNFYYKNLDGDLRARGATLPEFLRKQFKDSGIQLRVVGFRVSPEEMRMRTYREFQTALKELKGVYYDADDSSRLAEALQRLLLQMYFWVDAASGRDARDLPLGRGKNISRSDLRENPRWVGLQSGSYVVRVPSLRAVEQDVRVNPGDSLLLDLVEGVRGLSFRRCLYAESDHILGRFARKAPRESDWLLAVLQNQQRRGRENLEVMATLEKDQAPLDAEAAIQMVRPRWSWFEVPAADGKGLAPRLRVTALPDYPAPAWSLDLPRWPGDVPSSLQAWWTEEDLVAGGPGVVGRVFKPFGLRNHTWATEREVGKITLESVQVEKCVLETSPGQFHTVEDCLVVRLAYPVGQGPFFVQVPGWNQGQEHRFYNEVGKYTGIFWRITPAEASKLTELLLVSVPAFKKKALGGKTLKLGLPDERYRPGAPGTK